ncbi:hypothetical protein [Pseudoalteromonas sp. McH1-42]|uniref:hypothetical protein n=1 Tax=Pseudoalteromonas sp. McH1-42 TaxID=2917752 RepID=UPI001EF52820|nr:hypothetical protein [Pseudoalteromonas sp. McH1-42]MCG7563109.1 hypothetical protein [Pseudoalteromonas sp. McH1-42]
MASMKKIFNGIDVTLINEPHYSINSTDNLRSYEVELCRNIKSEYSSAHGLFLGEIDNPESSVIFLGIGGATVVHQYSFTIKNDICYVASGDSVFSLKLPTLELIWVEKVDFATCFGVFWVDEYDCLISWGELDICRLNSSGDKVWSISGPEIFTEGFEFDGDYVLVTDFDGIVHKISIETGESVPLDK